MSFDNYPVTKSASTGCRCVRPQLEGRAVPDSSAHLWSGTARSTILITMLTLTLKEPPAVPLEAEVLSPDVLAPLKHADGPRAARLPRQAAAPARRLLRRSRATAARNSRFAATSTKVKWIGRGMTRGRIRIVGNAGMHLGAYMKGGTIEVTGNACDWVGGEMTGGMIRIRGNAGGQIGAAYRGSLSGMNGGTILVDGSAGIEIGMRMKRGIIAVRGPVRDFAGLQMKGGTIVLMSGAELRRAWMSRGTIVSLKPLRLLPTFSHACDYNPTFLRLYAKHLAPFGFARLSGSYQRYTGDAAVPGKGEVLVWNPPN